MTDTQSNPPQVSTKRFGKLLRCAERLLACIGLCFIIYHLAFEITAMTSDSMSPTLQGTSYENGDRILLEKVTGWIRAPKRWEIYYFYDQEGTPVAKRIVALPGEKICIKSNQVFINGVELQRPKGLETIKYYAYGSLSNGREVDCGQGYFVLGDASIDSFDSRFTGVVAKERLRGRVWCVLWPFAHAKFVR